MGDNSKMRVAPSVPPRRGVPVALAVVAATAAVLISGCAGSQQAGTGAAGGSSASAPGGASPGGASPGGASSGAASSNGATGTPPAASGGASAGGASAGGASSGAGGASSAPASACATPGSYLTSIRTGQQAATDRVVFQFAGKLPSYTVTPVPQVVGDGSGKPVTIAGKSFLKVTFRGASAVCPATGHATYPGPAAATPNYAQLLGLAAAGDFEGYLTWGIGLAAKGGYHAYTLTAPSRVVIDISRP